MNAPRPLPNHLPAELLTLVGKIAIQSAYVDMLLGDLYGGLKGVSRDNLAATIHVLDTRTKIQEAEKLIKASIEEPERSKLIDILKRAADLLADRNLVLHAIIGYRDKNFKNPIYIPFRGKFFGKNPDFSGATLNPIFSDLDKMSQELGAVCSERGYIEFEPLPEKPK